VDSHVHNVAKEVVRFGSTRSCEQRPRASCLCRCSATRCMSVPLGRSPPALRGRCALGQTRSGLGVWVARPRGSGASKAAAVLPCLEGTVRMLCAVFVHWGGRQLSSAPRCALGQAGLAVWFVRLRGSGAAKTAGSAALLAAARRRLGAGAGKGG
jgi:hypothetical protein